MGNSVRTCYKGRAKATVVLTDGKVEEYFIPVRVAAVLNRHPKHMLVQLNSRRKLAQRRRKVTFMRPEEKLKSRREYVVLPNETVGGKFMDNWALAYNAMESNVRRRANLNKFKVQKTSTKPPSIFPAHNFGEHEQQLQSTTSKSLLLRSKRGTYSIEKGQDLGLKVARPRHREHEWRPSLDPIPESPWTALLTANDSGSH